MFAQTECLITLVRSGPAATFPPLAARPRTPSRGRNEPDARPSPSAADRPVSIEDARAGFYMVRTAALAGARANLSGAHLADALGATVALARLCQRQGYDADEQRAEVTLSQLVAEHLRVSRERAVRILDQLQRAAVIERDSARFDGARRRPTELRFTGAAIPFARVDAAAYDVIAGTSGRGLLRHLAVYITLVDLAGEQRHEHEGTRRIAVTSYAELELRSGVSLRSVKDIIAALVDRGVLDRHARHDANGMTAANHYRQIDVQPSPAVGGARAEPWACASQTVGVHQTDAGGTPAEPSRGATRTMGVRHPDDGGARTPRPRARERPSAPAEAADPDPHRQQRQEERGRVFRLVGRGRRLPAIPLLAAGDPRAAACSKHRGRPPRRVACRRARPA